MNSKYHCACGAMHWDDEACPGKLLGGVLAACQQLGASRVREVVDQFEINRNTELEAARLRLVEHEQNRKREELAKAKKTIERLAKEGIE